MAPCPKWAPNVKKNKQKRLTATANRKDAALDKEASYSSPDNLRGTSLETVPLRLVRLTMVSESL